ncbi:hypothetical protein C6502_10620 [Candidatus Poribacteria bacterium]|nr:MAG: hypothetical protein C6502_10620 [Candidatus Poribacteria bacterium]
MPYADALRFTFHVSRFTLLGLFLAACHAFPATFPFEEARPLYVGARALGMGNAFTAIADDATAGFWNPAGLIQWQGVKLFGVNKFHNRSDYGFDPKGIGYAYRGYGLFWGNKIALGVESGTPDFNYYSVARQVHPYIAVGASLKFKRKHPSDYYQFFGHSPSYDLGLLVKPRNNLRFGLLAGHLPGERGIRWLSLGTAYQWKDLLFAVDLVAPRGPLNETGLYYGIEWKVHRFVRLRGGRSDQWWTLGLGFEWRWIRIDVARIYEPDFTSDFISAELMF